MNNKKILALSLATTMLLSSTSLAIPLNSVVLGTKAFSTKALFGGVSGIQQALDAAAGKLYYSLEGQTNGFVGLFDGKVMTPEQKKELKNIEYTDKNGNDITKVTYGGIDDKDPIPSITPSPTATPTATVTPTPTPVPEITVMDAQAVNGTTIEVSFSDSAKQQFTVPQLSAGENTVSFVFKGKDYTTKVRYTPAGVEKTEFINYRNIKVTFNKLVDKVSAADPRNYYFEIVDGDANVYGALPTLQDSNQLSKIQTAYPGGADKWWKTAGQEHIVATDVNGKTVVNIYLPEDARFTNVQDDESASDDERTLGVEMQTSKTGPVTVKALIKNTSVNVAVRNVKDVDGKFTVDTSAQPIKILDEVKPELNEVKRVIPKGEETLATGNLGKDIGSFDLVRTLPSNGQVGDKLKFVYSEPVFDAHELDMSDLERYRDIMLYVNGRLIASHSGGNLNKFMTFDMKANATYEGSKTVTLDVEKAVLEAQAKYNDLFAIGLDYNIRFVGVTDLAGNIEVSSEHSFNVKFHDNAVNPPVIVQPVVKDLVQVADNVFRIEFNRADIEGVLKIKNPDGEGVGELSVPFKPSAEFIPEGQSETKRYFSYVAVPARDHETNGSVPQGLVQNQVLAYDKQDKIYRDISVEDVKVLKDVVAKGTLHGNSFFKNGMALVDDIKAPVAVDPAEIKYGERGASISFGVKDVTPWTADQNITPWVRPIAYVYNAATERFGNEIMPDQKNADTYLPIKVSYVDAKGAVHQAMVSNHNLRPQIGAASDLNPGYPKTITFDGNKNVVTLDLSKYPQLLGSDGKLVADASYKVELPAGYFTDSPRDISLQATDVDFTFNGVGYDILNVDEGRDYDKYKNWEKKIDSGLGFTSTNQTLNVHVEPKPAESPDVQYVPQTSKQLINYDEATKSMKIEFTGTINLDTLKDKNNYSFDGKTLAAWDSLLGTNTVIDYVVDNTIANNVRQYAIFKIPQDSIQEKGNYHFIVKGIKHPNGAMMTPVETDVVLYDNYRPVVNKAIVTGDKQIKLTFNEPIQYFVDTAIHADPDSTAKNFLVTIGGQSWTVQTAVMPAGATNNREIILNLGNVIPATGDITVTTVKDQNNNILVVDQSTDKNPMKETTYTATRP